MMIYYFEFHRFNILHRDEPNASRFHEPSLYFILSIMLLVRIHISITSFVYLYTSL
jgi:hypothetical protein